LKNIVSVSLFGSKRKYVNGAHKLRRSIQKNLPGWIMLIYHSPTVPEKDLAQLRRFGVELVKVEELDTLEASAWRFRAVDQKGVSRIIFRDSDSTITRREAAAVHEWVISGRGFHILRDHPFHASKIMAGMWGVSDSYFPQVNQLLSNWKFLNKYGSDQDFLAESVYPLAVSDLLVHATFHRHERASLSETSNFRLNRFASFSGESITSNLIHRSYARIKRLFGNVVCGCESMPNAD
jgi:hypothetical protein